MEKQSIWKRIVAVIAANKLVAAISGWGSWFLSSWIFDDVIYPLAIAFFGPLVGGLTMATIAIALSYYWLQKIVASEKDWFSMDSLYKVQKVAFWAVRVTKNFSFMKQSWVDKIEFVLTIFAFNLIFDPIIATLYFRRDDHSLALSVKDKRIFMWSSFISNTYWILRSWGLVTLIKMGWDYFLQFV